MILWLEVGWGSFGQLLVVWGVLGGEFWSSFLKGNQLWRSYILRSESAGNQCRACSLGWSWSTTFRVLPASIFANASELYILAFSFKIGNSSALTASGLGKVIYFSHFDESFYATTPKLFSNLYCGLTYLVILILNAPANPNRTSDFG